MKKHFALLFSIIYSTAMMAQVDVTKYYLNNYGFDDYYDYRAGETNTISKELKSVMGWTSELGADYTIVGTYEYGFKGTFNGGSVPESGYEGSTGGGLAISTG